MTEEEIKAAARKELQKHGIKGLCIDGLKHAYASDQELIDRLVNDTIYWEQRLYNG